MSELGLFSLEGNNAVITGGALGISFGIAKRYVEADAKVLIADTNEQAAEEAAAKLGANAHAMRADVSTDGEAIVQHCVDTFGSIDVLVNNAGIYPFAMMNELTPELFDKVIAVNLKGAAFCLKAAAQQMLKQGKGGRIINIAAIDGFHPSMVGLIAYDSSKGGYYADKEPGAGTRSARDKGERHRSGRHQDRRDRRVIHGPRSHQGL